MSQILVFGASTPYGVGGSNGGWPDLLKQKLHRQMYQTKSVPIEKHEVYNLSLPGATTSQIQKRFSTEVESYWKPNRGLAIVLMLGGNDAKAIDQPDNFVNSPEGFYKEMNVLVQKAKSYTRDVLLVGMKPVDE